MVEDVEVHVAITSTNLNQVHERLFENLKRKGYKFANYVSSQAFVWQTIEVGENAFIFENNVVQHGVKVGVGGIAECDAQVICPSGAKIRPFFIQCMFRRYLLLLACNLIICIMWQGASLKNLNFNLLRTKGGFLLTNIQIIVSKICWPMLG